MRIESFKDYHVSEEILKALSMMKYNSPTEVQSKVIPIALQKIDLKVKSQTGSGKTASFGIPLCELVKWEENKPQALILTPTRELAVQVGEEITNIGRFKRIKVVPLFGKQSFEKQKLALKQKTNIVVGTPGRVLDHLEKGTLNLEQLKYFVLDEADEMLNMGFIDQVETIMQKLPTKRTNWLFSATLPEDIENLSSQYMKSVNHIDVEPSKNTENHINHIYLETDEADKFSILKDISIVENPDSCLVFCRTQERVDHLNEQLKRQDFSCEKIHGGLTQEKRFAVMNDFKRGKFRYLVATDVAARGIDVENITLVIQYDLPLENESYVHRTGRTGRAGKKGKAITFITPFEENDLKEIEKYIGRGILKINPPSKNEVARKKGAFVEKNKTRPTLKEDKSADLNKDIMKLYFNGGKKKKLRAVDFVGTIAKIPGVDANDIGIITIQDNSTYVDILNGKGSIVLQAMKDTTVKGKLLKVHQARK